MSLPGKIPKHRLNPGSFALKVDTLTTRPTRWPDDDDNDDDDDDEVMSSYLIYPVVWMAIRAPLSILQLAYEVMHMW